MEATATPTNVHVYYDEAAKSLPPTIVGEVDIVLLDADGTIVATTDVTADGLPVADVFDLVNAQLAVFAALGVTHLTSARLWSTFDGSRAGYVASGSIRVLESAR